VQVFGEAGRHSRNAIERGRTAFLSNQTRDQLDLDGDLQGRLHHVDKARQRLVDNGYGRASIVT
jgi:hypothetical protein